MRRRDHSQHPGTNASPCRRLPGSRRTAYRLVERGALFQPAAPWQEQVVVAERLVTGQNPASAAGVAEAMVRLFRPEAR
ncbi:hypothetical protein sce4762 [Sorangium cellulosum So ce56]|uniref:DJ-1/PfpI domain-containing protein n=1 Tax=Sorangium cellulosum (strain So ce56) TaxID=448385 RepID=A9FEU8_SORC5|nr:hypothetical protein sce4762 [Sorangium cellulosum So ce56]